MNTAPALLLLCFAMLTLSCRSGPGNAAPTPMGSATRTEPGGEPVHTFSVIGYDPQTGELGVAVQSKFFSVGTVVPWAKAKVGAIATQSYANVTYGEQGLRLLAAGQSASDTLQALTGRDEGRDFRQAGVVDAQGRAASFTGAKCNAWAGHHVGTNYCVQGNLLTGPEVIAAMRDAYEKACLVEGSHLADWLMASLAAGQAAGGDKRGQQSAALLVVRERGGYEGANDRFIDLRVEDHPEPIVELQRLLDLHKQFFRRSHERKQ